MQQAARLMSLSAYVHIPFCTHKCEFCDFAAFAGLSHLEDQYCEIVCKEIDQRDCASAAQRKLDSVFYGGGTPGLIGISNLSLIHKRLTEKFGTSADCEVNLETTPHAITAEKVQGWRELGVNRLSIGVESFQDDELKAIGRDSAHRYLGGVRSSNWRSISVYMKDFLGDETVELIDFDTRMREAIMLGLRLRSGLDLGEFEKDFGINLLEKFRKQIDKLFDGGFVEVADQRLRITDRGVLVSNSIISELF
ncbi:MAG: radical SAM protein [Candidatus Melainabacteria bacterium]|nr:radical SAM protein [Candidatus Melainabacteria bacterium]